MQNFGREGTNERKERENIREDIREDISVSCPNMSSYK